MLDGFTVFVTRGDLEVGAGLLRTGTYEPHVTKELIAALRPSAVFVDVGANIGYFSMLAASLVGQTGRVIAFEPNPHNCDLIRKSIGANGFHNVALHERAVGDTEADFAIDITGSNGALREERRAGDLVVRTVTLDRCLASESRIDVIKMDVEGFEGRAIRGMRGLLERHRPILFTEFSPDELVRRSRVEPRAYMAELQTYGYDLFVLPLAGERSVQSQSAEDVMATYEAAQVSHLDLVAYPR